MIARDLEALEAMAALGSQFPPDAEMVYRRDPAVGPMTALIYRPDGWRPADRRRGIVMFFGGGWRRGTVFQFAPQADHWRRLGYVVVLPCYRVQEQHGASIPDCIRDARSALRWVARETEALGIDPERIVVGGGSAGGHLAASAPVVELDHPEEVGLALPMAEALLLFNPVLQLSSPGEAMARLTAGFGLTPEELRNCDPVQHLGLPYPPTLIQHGTSDEIVPFASAEAFADRLIELGVACRLVPFEGREHGFFNLTRGRADFRETMRVVDDFLLPHTQPASGRSRPR